MIHSKLILFLLSSRDGLIHGELLYYYPLPFWVENSLEPNNLSFIYYQSRFWLTANLDALRHLNHQPQDPIPHTHIPIPMNGAVTTTKPRLGARDYGIKWLVTPPHTELRTRQNKQATNGGKLVKQFTKLPANERTNPMAVNWETTNPLSRQPANRQVQSSKRLKCHKNQHSHTHVRVCA